MPRRTGSLEAEVARFLSRCVRDNGCLMGPGRGYGDITYAGGLRISAHRAVFIVARGAIPKGLVVRHACDRIGCVEIQHLSVGTHADNSRDASERHRLASGLEHHKAHVRAEEIEAAVSRYLAGGFTQAEMGEQMGVSSTTFGRWVRRDIREDLTHPGVSVGRGSRHAKGLQGCGTKAGYEQHHKRREPVCDPCRNAHREYMRAYKAARRARAA